MRRRPIPTEPRPVHGPIPGAIFLGSWHQNEPPEPGDPVYDFFFVPPDGLDASSFRYRAGATSAGMRLRLDDIRCFRDRMRDKWHGWPKVLAAAEKRGLIPVEEGVSS